MKKIILFFAFILSLGYTSSTYSQWSTDPNINNVVASLPANQINPQVTSDGSGGVIITWEDERNLAGTTRIYGERIDRNGIVKWSSGNGKAICNYPSNQTRHSVCSDGAGGIFVSWSDDRTSSVNKIFSQRVRSDGAIMWNINGVLTRTNTYFYSYGPLFKIVQSGSGIILINSDLYYVRAQYVDAYGNLGFDRIVFTGNISATQQVGFHDACTDGANGAIFTYQTWFNSGPANIGIQKINSFGDRKWVSGAATDSNGIDIAHLRIFDNTIGMLCHDEDGGAFICWTKNSGPTSPCGGDDVYAQRVNSTGQLQFGDFGITVANFCNSQTKPQMIADGWEGAIISWVDYRWLGSAFTPADTGVAISIYAQDISFEGHFLWDPDGVKVAHSVDASKITDARNNPRMVANDVVGGVIITWPGYRFTNHYPGIYAQRINRYGSALWTPSVLPPYTNGFPNGIPVSNGDRFNVAICGDGGFGGGNIAWEDTRNIGTNGMDLYASHIDGAGILHRPERQNNELDKVFLLQNYPNPFNPATIIRFNLPAKSEVSLKVYNLLGQEIATLVNENMNSGIHTAKFDATAFSSGIYIYKLSAGDFTEVKTMLLIK